MASLHYAIAREGLSAELQLKGKLLGHFPSWGLYTCIWELFFKEGRKEETLDREGRLGEAWGGNSERGGKKVEGEQRVREKPHQYDLQDSTE